MEKKTKKPAFVDDGRVIADMTVDGMPGPLFGRKVSRKAMTDRKEPAAKLSRRDYLHAFWGIISSYILFGLVVFGGFALFIWFCIRVWFK